VLVADSAALMAAPADALTELLVGLAGGYSHIVAAAATVGRDVIPRLAARLDLMPVTDVVEILGPTRFVRPIHAGNALETLTSPQPTQLLTLRAAAFRPAAPGPAAPVEPVAFAGQTATQFVAAERSNADRPDLATARIVVAGGVALGSAENFALIEQLAAVLGAAVGATRAAVDAGYAPNDWQIGQTGKIVAPELYIGIGISGALQHLAGIAGAKKIVAINIDPDAPLMRLADLALAADLATALPALTAALGQGR
jgi:electron transfer flavoprotein alpha subunit